LWVADATYLRTCQGWPYWTVVLDAVSRKVVGRSIAQDAWPAVFGGPTFYNARRGQ
jgi:transposase InsO family protein